MTVSAATARPFAELFGGRPGDGDIASLARAAARAGYAVLPVKPGTKDPLCTLTDRQRKAADKAEADERRLAGKRNWERARHGCGEKHASGDPAVAHRVFKRLGAEHPGLNIAAELFASHALVVDADTVEELTSFTTLWAERENAPELVSAAPTVLSPGEIGPDGQWKHSNGGHFWFLLPGDVDLGDVRDAKSIPIGADPDHQAQLKIKGYVLLPPSVRPEGEYRMASDAHIAPDWLIELVQLSMTDRRVTRQHRQNRALDTDDHISLSLSAIPWSAQLEPRGYVLWHKVDRCGCEIWTAPGEHASPKSATAHDAGCSEFDTVDGFVHFWTTNLPDGLAASGQDTFSKLQFTAWSDHDGDMGSAMREMGIERRTGSDPAILSRNDNEVLEKVRTSSATAPEADSGEGADDDGEGGDEEEIDPVDALIAELIPASELDKIPPPVPLVDGILDLNSLARVIGTSGHGKSFFILDLASHVALGKPWHGRECVQGDVVYMVAEGVSGMRARVRAWESHHGVRLDDKAKFLPRAIQVMSQLDWLVWVAAMERVRPVLIIIDTQARVTVGANENEAKDMGILVDRAELLRQQTGACVILIHHKGRQGDHGRGSTVVPAALDVEISVTKQGMNRITVLSEKQKEREDFKPISLDLIKVGESAVLVSAGTSTPFEKTGIDENSSIRDRLAKLLYTTFNDGNGATKAEVWAVVTERDRGPSGRAMSRSKFYEAWARLESDNVLVYEETEAGKRWSLDHSEAVRLGLYRTVSGSSGDLE